MIHGFDYYTSRLRAKHCSGRREVGRDFAVQSPLGARS
jgi:hypothetical protein